MAFVFRGRPQRFFEVGGSLVAFEAVGLGRPRRFLEAGGCQVAFVWDRIIIGFNIHDIQELNTLMVRVDGCLWPLLPFV